MPTSRIPRLVSTLRTPGHRRGVVVRRAIAVALLIAALASALSAAKELPRVPVFSRDLPAGAELALADVDLARLPSSSIPDSAVAANPEELTGRVITAAAGRGEVITDARLLGEDLVSSLVGGSEAAAARMIPVKLAEPDIIPHLHHGDTVDVVTAVDAAPSPLEKARRPQRPPRALSPPAGAWCRPLAPKARPLPLRFCSRCPMTMPMMLPRRH